MGQLEHTKIHRDLNAFACDICKMERIEAVDKTFLEHFINVFKPQ